MFTKPPVILLLAMLCAMRAAAQELEPRAYSASPIGTNFLLVGIGRSSGDVVFDPTVPITDVHADINAATLGAGRTFNLGGHLMLATVALPYVWGDITGKVFEQAASTTRSGLGDARMKVSVTLRGTPALTPAEFAKASRRTNIGTSLTVAAPAGQYYGDKLINIGTNRWAFKPEVGLSHPTGRWTLDLAGGVWLFTANDQFYQGDSTRTQDPLFVFQGHASYNVTRRAWAAVDATGMAAPTFAWMAARRRPGRTTPAWAPRWRCQSALANPQARVQHRRVDADRCGFHDRSGRVAVPVVRSDLTQAA